MRPFRLRPFKELIDLIFPRHCCCCGDLLVGDERHLCTHCLLHLPYTHNAVVPENETEQHFQAYPAVAAAYSLLYFRQNSATRQIIHHIKYRGDKRLALAMGRMMGQQLATSGRFDQIDLIVPVPLHRRREQQRGYNQSELLCRGIACALYKPVEIRNLVRIVNTESQTHMSADERAENVRGAFCVRRPDALAGHHILLVDDVITTGSTTAACCNALLTVENIRISVASLALAVG